MAFLCFAFPMLFLLFVCSISSSFMHSFHDDPQSLLEFKKLITIDPHQSMADWSSSNPFCNWTAVTCSRRHPNKVVVLNLTTMDLRGIISPFLGNLSFLRSLDLSGNALHGLIPIQLGRLFRLRELYLDDNQLDGNIPSQLSSCRNLVNLVLSSNNLSGNIPPELGSLTHLRRLYLGVNSLTGTIPSSLGNLSALIHLDIAINSMVGTIPPQLGLLGNLQTLDLHSNELSHSLPISLSNISSLSDLDLSRNKFNGGIPQELGLLNSLQTLKLSRNELSGTIPTSLSNMSTLTNLAISTNKLSGNIPRELGLLTHLQMLYLNENELSGSIPTSLTDMIKLSAFFLSGNQLNGNIPNSIGNCSKLQFVALNDNKLTGSVPMEMGKLSLLEKLDLQSNQLGRGSATRMSFLIALTNCSHLQTLKLNGIELSGVLPPTIGKLSTNLSILSLSRNMIEGNIPPHINNLSSLTFLDLSENLLNGCVPSLGNLEKLERLYIGDNRLEGKIPDDFRHLQRLGLLDISRNKLSGKIPNSLAPLKQLRRLFLHHNQLSGSIPANLGDCQNLELLDLSHNMLTGSIPSEISGLSNLQFYLNLSWNLLEDSLPIEISKIDKVQAINISNNQLTGLIPLALGNCIELQSLDLSKNAFQGSIPMSIGNLQNLMNLDLSVNSLSGTIPVTLKKLTILQYLNLSFNNLTGEIPKGGFFAKKTIIMSLIGNPGLTDLAEPPTSPTPKGQSTFVKSVLLPVGATVTIAFILCCLLLGFLYRRKKYVLNFHFLQIIFQKLQYQKISYQDLHAATNGFADTNLIGTGRFGLVYKGILSDYTLVAVKVLQLQNDHVEKSFKVECSVLQKVRHRNLVRIITSCSNLNFKALVFQFMPNGSLEKYLYHEIDGNNGEDVCKLGFKTRLDIAIDVAHAIEYLHHDCFVQVLHCDIKPNNVLLDEHMSGHITDFGIARLIGETSIDPLTSTLALKGSLGYIAPEYGLGVTASTKGDVYSYGILLLEMLTRKQPTNHMFVEGLNLHKWVSLAFPNRVKEVIDQSLFSKVDRDEFEENNIYTCLLSLLRVGLLCSKNSAKERPTMRDVVTMLESIKKDLVSNAVDFQRLRKSISNLLSNTNATKRDASTSNDQSSSTS